LRPENEEEAALVLLDDLSNRFHAPLRPPAADKMHAGLEELAAEEWGLEERDPPRDH
jgi:hypothetical protein